MPRPARLQTLLFQGQTHRINMLCLRGCAKTCVGIPGPRGALLTWSHCPPVRTTAVRKITLRSRNSAMFLTTKPGSAPRAFLQLAGAQPWSGALRTQLPPPPDSCGNISGGARLVWPGRPTAAPAEFWTLQGSLPAEKLNLQLNPSCVSFCQALLSQCMSVSSKPSKPPVTPTRLPPTHLRPGVRR